MIGLCTTVLPALGAWKPAKDAGFHIPTATATAAVKLGKLLNPRQSYISTDSRAEPFFVGGGPPFAHWSAKVFSDYRALSVTSQVPFQTALLISKLMTERSRRRLPRETSRN